MKHLNNLACMLAMLTAGSMGFTACSSDDVVDGGNTNNGMAGKMVKTSFALNIPYGNKSGRMTADNTQANNTFTYMNDMRMLAFEDAPIDATKKSVKKIVLANGSTGAFDKDESSNRLIYRDVMIPVGTNGFLFYGKKEAGIAEEKSMDDKFTYGSIVESDFLTSDPTPNTDAKDAIEVSKLDFKLNVIHSDAFDGNSIGSTAKVVADALENVYDAHTGDGTASSDLYWKNCKATATAEHTPDAVEIHAANLFAQFSSLTAGSAASAIATLKSLKSACGRNTSSDEDNTPINPDKEKNDILLAVAKACDAAITKIENEAENFPNNLGLPDGAAKGKFNEAGDFEYAAVGIPATTQENSAGLDYTKVTYPASLNYFVNTPVKASNKAIENLNTTNGWPSYANWSDKNYSWSDWENEVGNNTRSIALKNVIQYAVASLETNVSITTSNLKDNAAKVGKLLADQSINVSEKGFKLTGVLIGGQPSMVGYDYLPTTSTTFDYTVYDRNMNVKENSITSGTNKGTTNYTLVLDNTQSATDGNYPSVYVTIELVNNTGVDFYGADGVVPNGSKFYLVGKLNPQGDEKSTVTQPTGKTINNVFVQDHKTVANLKIGANSLKNAYNTIPDLRSTQISLGLAVDLTWEAGITFDVEL